MSNYGGFIHNAVKNEWVYTDTLAQTSFDFLAGYYGLSSSYVKSHAYIHTEGQFREYCFRNSIIRTRPIFKQSERDRMKKRISYARNRLQEIRNLADGWVQVKG